MNNCIVLFNVVVASFHNQLRCRNLKFAKLKFFPCRLQLFDLSENGYLSPSEAKTNWERCFQTKKNCSL